MSSETPHGNETKRPLKVTFLSHSDTIGGASLVTLRLMRALRDLGVDARMVVYTVTLPDPNVSNPSTRHMRGFKFMLERARIALANGFSRADLFKVSIANVGLPLHRHPWVKEADVVCLGWINQGLLSLKGIEKIANLGKPLVWVMHDMWQMTGICHHSIECPSYTEQCGKCKFLHSDSATDLSRSIFLKKQALYRKVPITFVAVSNWLAECAKKSTLLKNADVRVIPNAFPINSFYTAPRLPHVTIPDNKELIVMGAARLDDPIKGLNYAIDALNYLFDNRPDVARRAVAVFFGSIRDRSLLDNIRFPHIFLDRVNDSRLLREIFASAKVVLSTSLYETLPGTLIEGQASGCLPVTFGRGGQGDIVTHLRDGYIADYKDSRSVAEGIIWALDTPAVRTDLHESVRRRFDAETVALRYIDLFNELLSRKG